jgi:hypothetical protein
VLLFVGAIRRLVSRHWRFVEFPASTEPPPHFSPRNDSCNLFADGPVSFRVPGTS